MAHNNNKCALSSTTLLLARCNATKKMGNAKIVINFLVVTETLGSLRLIVVQQTVQIPKS